MWLKWLPTFRAKDEVSARRAQLRRLIRWRKRIYRHLSMIPAGSLIAGVLMFVCHFRPERFPTICAWFARFMERG